MKETTALTRIWKLLCSLKLAIFLASAATLLTMGGSLVMHFNPEIFGAMDRLILSEWYAAFGRDNLSLSWWLVVMAVLVLLFGLNTLCCFLDWLFRVHLRWRKTGEYLIHLGFVLILAAYAWGSVSGFRTDNNRVFVGQTIAVPQMPGYYLRLDAFDPILNASGRPIDMKNSLTLLQGDQVLQQKLVRTNHPLNWGGLTVLAASYGQVPDGFSFHWPGRGAVELRAGSRIPLPGGGQLKVTRFVADGRQRAGAPRPPALELEYSAPGQNSWRTWYALREGPPKMLLDAGIRLRPTAPLYRTYSLLTINADPGTPLALAGALIMGVGVLLALVSFYLKRSRGDRPEV